MLSGTIKKKLKLNQRNCVRLQSNCINYQWTGSTLSRRYNTGISFPLPGRYTTAMPQPIKTYAKIGPFSSTMIYGTHNTGAFSFVSKKLPSLTHSVNIHNSSQNLSYSSIEQLLFRFFTLRQMCEVRFGTLWVSVYTAFMVTLHNASGPPVSLAHH